MNKEKLKSLAKDGKYISGIYNYCDSWCERCPQTSRCLNFHINEEEFSDPETRDINNEAFWKKISEIMQTNIEMLHDMMVAAGIDPEELDIDKCGEQKSYEDAETHVLCRMAKEYADMVRDWIDGAEDLFGAPGHGMNTEDKDNIETLSNDDNMSIILWYQHQIYVKLNRAVSGLIEETDFDEDDDYAKDYDGSAKVALIGIDRSMAAWGNLHSLLPGFHDRDIRNILIHLEKLKRKTENTFSGAREFIRPGFDSIDLNS